MTKILTITSGKGGVGKTNISLNLALALAALGKRVCLFDADLGLANVNILTGIQPEYTLASVMAGEKSLDGILLKDFYGVDIIPGSSGVEKMEDLSRAQTRELVTAFLALDDYDYMIFDTSAGVSPQVLAFCRACHEVLLVITPEPTSLTDAYSLLKILGQKGKLPPIKVIINRVNSVDGAKTAYGKLRTTVAKFLPISIGAMGIVAQDAKIPRAVASQTPFLLKFPDGLASHSIWAIARKLIKETVDKGDSSGFWEQCLGEIRSQVPRSSPPLGMEERLLALEDKVDRLLNELVQIRSLLSESTSPAPVDMGEWVKRHRRPS